MTWASTQPPMVTEPSTRPPSPTSILAPSLRGVVPRVLTRVATATLDSFSLQLVELLEELGHVGYLRLR